MPPERGKTLRDVTITPAPRSVQSSGGGVPTPAGSTFEVVRRGYDRDQVDRALRELRDRLAAAESARQAAERHAQKLEDELRAAKAAAQSVEPGISKMQWRPPNLS